jgi:two-component system, chemotaxis family, chemotaxis protein CheY
MAFSFEPSKEHHKMKKILIVDDSMAVRRQVIAALAPAGFELLEAKDGLEALELLQSTAGVTLVICDINMPRMSGFEMLDALRELSLPAAPPIVMLTSEGRADLIERAKRGGAKGWLVKPFKPDHLVAVARKLTGAN